VNSSKGLFTVLIIVLLLAGGYFLYNSQKAKQVTPTAASTQQVNANVFTSIKDALSRALSLKCEYPDDKGNTVTVYIKGGSVRMMGYATGPAGAQGQALMKDNKMYTWDDKTKKGTVMAFNKEEMQQAAESMKKEMSPQPTKANQQEDFLAAIEKYKKYCKTETVSDSLFTVPSDVQFVDLNEQMKKSGVDMQKMMMEQKQQPTPTPTTGKQTTIAPTSGY